MAIAEDQNRGVALRPLTPADCERVVGWIESEDAMYQWSGPASFTWPLDVEQLLRDLHGGSDSQYLLAATDGRGELIGHARLAVSPHHRLGWIGRIVIAPGHRGRGLASAMMRELVAYGFDELGLHRLQLGVYTFNTAAIAAYRAAGFVVEGELRDSTLSSSGYWNGFVMGMLESDRTRGSALSPAGDGAAIRGARFADRHRIAALLTQLGYPHDASQAGERLMTWMGDRQGTVLVADVDGSVAGVIAVHAIPYFERPGASARIVALAVDGALRRAEIGRRLVHAAHQWAGAQGCVDAEVTSRLVREDAHRFYVALGYEDQGARSGRLKRTLGHSIRDA